VESRVFEQENIAIAQSRDGGLGDRADAVGGEKDEMLEFVLERHRDRF